MLKDKPSIDKLRWIMSQLRNPETGCPWDLKQTFDSIVPYTIEEAYEVADAIEKQDFAELKLELGDLLFQSIFYAQLGKEQNLFDFNDVVEGICEKLIRRHPHVFSDSQLTSDEEIKANWEQEKARERTAKNEVNIKEQSVLDDIPKALPALSRAYKIQKRVSAIGFDWPNIDGALDKVFEEITEVKQEIDKPISEQDQHAIADELGDLYFALTNVVRHLGLKPEQVVAQANKKFESRFRQVEQLAAKQNTALADMTLEQMDELWEQAKRQ